MSITRCDDIWTAERFADAIGRTRPAWVEVLATSELAILIRVAGESVLVRHISSRGYQWLNPSAIRRREDCDVNPEPAWLQQARASSRPPLILHDLLNPNYSQRALEGRAECCGEYGNCMTSCVERADGERTASLDPVSRGIFEEAVRLGRVSARHAVDPWIVNARRYPEGE